MIKKSCNRNYFIFGIIIVFYILLSINLIKLAYGDTTSSTNKPEEIKKPEAEKYGENLIGLIGTPGYDSETVESFFNDPESEKAFFRGFGTVWKDENKKQELVKNFLLKDGKGNAKIPDKVKIKILEYLSTQESGDVHNKFLSDIAKEKIKNYNLKGNVFDGVNIPKEKIKDLIFQGSKLGVPNKDGGVEMWVDFDKIPRWTKKIELIGVSEGGKQVDKFKIEFKTGNGPGTKTVIFSKGTIGQNGEVIGPDGYRIGSNMPEGIQSIGINSEGKLEVKYKVNEKEKVLTLENADLRKSISELKERLSKNGINFDVDEVLKKLNGKILTTGKASGPDSNGLVFSNQLNVLFGNTQAGYLDQMEISYDGNGNPEFKTKGTATVTTTGFNGRILDAAESWKYGTDSFTKEAILKYNAYGELKEAQNAMITTEIARVYAPEGKFTKINIVESGIADAISRGDFKSAFESGVMQSGVIEIILAKGDKSNVQEKVIQAIYQSLNDATGSTTFQNRLNDAKNLLEKSIDASLTNLLTFGTPGEDVSGKEKLANDLSSGAASALRSFVEDPANLKALATGDKNTLKTYLKGYISENPLLENLDTEIAGKIIGFTGKTPEEVKKEFQNLINSKEFDDLITTTINENTGSGSKSNGFDSKKIGKIVGDKVKERLNDKTKISIDLGKIPDNLGNYVSDLVTRGIDNVKAEIANSEKSILENLKSSYGNDPVLRVDKSTGEIFAQGDNRLVIEVASTMNKVTVNPIGNGNIRLYSYGVHNQPLVEFSAGNTNIPTGSITNSYQIGLIVNQNIPNQIFTVQDFGQGYRVYDAKEVVNKFAAWGTATVTKEGIPIIGSISVPFNTLYNVINAGASGDIADNPNSKVEITYKPNTDWGPMPGRFFIGRIINRIANRKANEMAQQRPFELSEMSDTLIKGLNDQYNLMYNSFNKDTSGFTKTANQLTMLVNTAQKLGATIPRQTEISDSLSMLQSMSAGKPEFLSRFQPLINALNSNQISYGQSIQITPNQIIAGGRVIYQPQTPQEQVALRMFLRNIYQDPNKLTEHRDRTI